MFRLAPLLITATAVSDETSLMQGVKPQHVTSKDEKSKSVSNLLETAKTMLKNGATPDVVAFANATLTEIIDAVLPRIADAHDADQLLVRQTRTMFTDALQELETGTAEIARLYGLEVGHSHDHRLCRGIGSEAREDCTTEYCACEDKRDCDYDLWRTWKHFAWEESDLRFKSGEIEDHFCAENANGTTWLFRDYSVAKFPEWMRQKVVVEEWETTYDEMRPQCVAHYETLDRKTEDCDEHQQHLEETSCLLANEVSEVKNRFADFWVYASATYQQVMDEVHCLEIDRCKELTSLATVQCLLQRTSERNGRPCEETTETTEEMTHCEQVQTTCDPIVYPEIPEYPEDCAAPDAGGRCVPGDRHVPCTPGTSDYSQVYVDQEYHDLWQPPQAPFRAPDYHVDSHFEPTLQLQHHERCPPGAQGTTWDRDASGNCYWVIDGHTSQETPCECIEHDRSTDHWDTLQVLRDTGNSHCNQRPACVPCTLVDESPRQQNINYHQNNGFVHPWVRVPQPEHECHQATIRHVADGVIGGNRVMEDAQSWTYASFTYGDVGSGDFCPTLSVISEEDCLAAVQSLLPAGQQQGRTTLVAGTWAHVPPGCSVQSHPTHGAAGDWAAHYNRGNGHNDGGYTKVCVEGHPLPTTGLGSGMATHYHILGYGMANCPAGKSIDTHEECEEAHIALGLEVAPKWTGTHSSIPGLCSTREADQFGGHHFHFNSNPVGVARSDLSPVCKE